MKGNRVVKPEWFEIPHIVYWLIIMPALGYMMMLYLAPEMLPLQQLGPIGTLGTYMVEQRPRLLQAIFMATSLIHVLEGVYASYLCRKLKLTTWTTIKWTIQTILMGIASLSKLTSKVSQLDKLA